MNRLYLLLALFLVPPLEAQTVTAADHVLRATSSALIVVDWTMTVDGLRRGLRESNPLLGPHPALGKANLLIGAGLVANAFLVPRIRERDLRYFVWSAVIALELNAIWTNSESGLRLNFRF